jgi:hypothetical protein
VHIPYRQVAPVRAASRPLGRHAALERVSA